MTAREYRTLCRIKAVGITRFLTWLIQMVILGLTQYYSLPVTIVAAISITLWIYGPSKIMWILEHIYSIKHDKVSYK